MYGGDVLVDPFMSAGSSVSNFSYVIVHGFLTLQFFV